LSALFPACFKISGGRFVNMSARKVPGERKTANEQLLLLAQVAGKNVCITCHVSFLKKVFFQCIINYHQVAITINMQTFGKP